MPEILPLIQTKLYRPSLPASFVHRPRLIDRLDGHWKSRPLTLISAPAGFGKSVLACIWLESCNYPSGWVSLDEEDNDLHTFTAYLLAAVKMAFPDISLQSQALLETPTMPPVPLLARHLLNDFNQIKKPFVLALDDIHTIREQAIIDLLAELLKHPPPAMHLLLIGRQDPPIPVASLRAYQRLTEIRTRDLRFSPPETAELLKLILQRDIEEDLAAKWTENTEGWATALHLAALSISYRQETVNLRLSAQGDSHYLQDYLLAEVLAHIPPEKQIWLLKTSLLNRFCAPLCQAVCREEGETLTGPAFVSWLQASNMFLIPLDDRGEWFRFHHLFQNHLQNLLQRRLSDEEIADQHLRAGRWLAENSWIGEAIQHALAGGDTEVAVGLVAQHRYQLMNAERWNQLTYLVRLFPDDVVDNDPILAITKAHLPTAYGSEQARMLARVNQLVADLPANSPVARMVKGEIAYYNILWGIMTGPAEVAIEQANTALSLLPQQAQWLRSGVLASKAVGLQMSGDIEKGISLINETLEDPDWTAIGRARLLVGQTCACFMEGNLEGVQQSAGKCLEIAIKNNLWATVMEEHYFLGIAYYLRNQLDMAESHLSVLVEKRVLAGPGYLAQAVCTLTCIYHARRQPEKASEAFGLVFSHLEEVGNTFFLDLLRAFQVELALDQGNLAQARRLSQLVDIDMNRPVWYHYTYQLTPIKLWLAEGGAKNVKKAVVALEQLSQQLLGLNRKLHYIDVLALQALAFEARGDRQLAEEKLTAALRLGEPGGFIRSFVDLGPPMADLLTRLHKQEVTGMDAYIFRILAAFQMEEPDTTTPDMENPLTRRELQTLKLLATDLSPQEIASEMTVSSTTMRTHARNAYQKLGVHSRFEAVQRAKELGLL